jgi:flagellar protein FliS
MQLERFVKSYRTLAVTTASPGQLILMLFDGALRFLTEAQDGFDDPDFVKRNERIHNNLVKAQNVLKELQGSLNMEVGEFSERMYALYNFMMAQLRLANLKKDPEPLRVVIGMLNGIRDAWAQMLEQTSSQVA